MGIITQLDRQLLLTLNFDGGAVMDTLMWGASDKLIWLPLYLLMLWMMGRRYGWRGALTALAIIVLMVAFADQVSTFFKNNLPKYRPSREPDLAGLVHTVRGYTGGKYGTVSAHAATITAIALFSSGLIRERWWTIVAVIWTALVVYSRIYLGVHYPLDVMCGITVGILTGRLGLYGWGKLPTKFKSIK